MIKPLLITLLFSICVLINSFSSSQNSELRFTKGETLELSNAILAYDMSQEQDQSDLDDYEEEESFNCNCEGLDIDIDINIESIDNFGIKVDIDADLESFIAKAWTRELAFTSCSFDIDNNLPVNSDDDFCDDCYSHYDDSLDTFDDGAEPEVLVEGDVNSRCQESQVDVDSDSCQGIHANGAHEIKNAEEIEEIIKEEISDLKLKQDPQSDIDYYEEESINCNCGDLDINIDINIESIGNLGIKVDIDANIPSATATAFYEILNLSACPEVYNEIGVNSDYFCDDCHSQYDDTHE